MVLPAPMNVIFGIKESPSGIGHGSP